jgi:hypothetical protein
MVKHTGAEFRLLAATPAKQTVIHNEYVRSGIVSQVFQVIIDHIGCKHRCEAQPIRLGGIQKTVERILGKIFFKRTGALLHVHAASYKDVAKLISQK